MYVITRTGVSITLFIAPCVVQLSLYVSCVDALVVSEDINVQERWETFFLCFRAVVKDSFTQ